MSDNYFLLNNVPPNNNAPINNIKKIKNSALAIEAAPAAIPVNPNIPAMMAIIRNVADHFNMSL